MRFAFKALAGATAVAVLLLAAYGAWSLLSNDAGSTGATAATSTTDVSRQMAASPASPQPTASEQGETQDEMVKLCTEHMREMAPVMEEMMRDIMAGMMGDGMMGGDGMSR